MTAQAARRSLTVTPLHAGLALAPPCRLTSKVMVPVGVGAPGGGDSTAVNRAGVPATGGPPGGPVTATVAVSVPLWSEPPGEPVEAPDVGAGVGVVDEDDAAPPDDAGETELDGTADDDLPAVLPTPVDAVPPEAASAGEGALPPAAAPTAGGTGADPVLPAVVGVERAAATWCATTAAEPQAPASSPTPATAATLAAARPRQVMEREVIGTYPTDLSHILHTL